MILYENRLHINGRLPLGVSSLTLSLLFFFNLRTVTDMMITIRMILKCFDSQRSDVWGAGRWTSPINTRL